MDDNVNQAPSEYVTAEEPVSSRIPSKKIISLIVGVIAVIGLIVFILIVLIPRFTSGSSKDVTLEYWGIFEDPAPLEEAANLFHQDHPNVKVTIKMQDIKTLKKYYTRITTRIDNGNGPDIYRYHYSWLPELLQYLQPLDQGLVNSSGLDKNYFPIVEKSLKYNGAYYGIPIHFDTLALFINTELFTNAGITSYPTNWDDLFTVAKQLTVKDAESGKITQSGAALGTFDNIAHASDIVSLLLVQNNASLVNPASTKQKAVDALDFYTLFATGDTKVWDESMENSKVAFKNGKLAMYFGYSWDIFQLLNNNENLKFVVVPVPHLGERDSTIASMWVEGVSSKTKHTKEAMEFLQFLSSKEIMEQLYAKESKIRLFGELYPRSDMAAKLKDKELIYPFVAQGPKAVSTIFASDTYDDALVDELNKYLGDAVRGVLEGSSSDSAVDTLTAGISQKLGQYAGQKK